MDLFVTVKLTFFLLDLSRNKLGPLDCRRWSRDFAV